MSADELLRSPPTNCPVFHFRTSHKNNESFWGVDLVAVNYLLILPTTNHCFIWTISLWGTSKYDVITFRDIFTPPPPLSYCVIIWHTSGWCLFDDIILGQALRICSYPVCCGFLSAKQTCKPYCLPCSKKVRVKYKNIYYICYIYSECAVCDSQDTSL